MSKELFDVVNQYEALYKTRAGDKLNVESAEVLSIAVNRMEDCYFKEQLDALLKHTQSEMTDGDIIMSCIIFESLKVMCFLDTTGLGNHEISAIKSNMKKRIKSLKQKMNILGLKNDDTKLIEQMISDFEAEIELLDSKRTKEEKVEIEDKVIKEKQKKKRTVKPKEKPKKESKPKKEKKAKEEPMDVPMDEPKPKEEPKEESKPEEKPSPKRRKNRSNNRFVFELLDSDYELVDRAFFSDLINAIYDYEDRESDHKRLLLKKKEEDIVLIEE